MPLTPGTRLGPYEVTAPLGAGGMGEVYRAKDTRLGRDVAVKVLPQHLSDQPDVRARFEREAKTISSLNHPHICMLFDVGREDEVDYLVMELIEGDTLAERLKRGPLPAAELLRLGAQISDALDRAHRAGVIHRDLKPGNVMLTRSGAKLMDFGLSRATIGGMPGSSSAHSVLTLSHSPTIAPAVTAEGTLLGTFQYMAPELLEGKEADARSDIWALGCVLYEMATGHHAFQGRSQASLIAAILEREPAVIGEVPSGSGVIAGTAPPHGMERLIRNCLAKDPEERIQTAHDVKLRLLEIAESAGIGALSAAASSASVIATAGALAAARPRPASARLPWAVAGAAVLAAAGVFAWLAPRAFAPPPPAVRFSVRAPDRSTDIYWPRVSPDGRFLLFQAPDTAGVNRAYIRPMDQTDAHAVPGTEGLQRAYWSPDSREIAFVAGGRLQRVALAGGAPIVICAAPGGADVSWGSKGQVLLDASFTDSIRIVPAGGGELRPATRIDRANHEVGNAWPFFLPDGEHFLFIGTRGDAEDYGNIRLGKLGSLDSKLIGKSDGRAEYGAGGWVLYPRDGTLFAQRLDLAAGKLTGQPITLVDGLRMGGAQGHFSLSPSGVFAFANENGAGSYTIQEADRTGKTSAKLPVSGLLSNPQISPDGTRLLYVKSERGLTLGGEVYVVDLKRATDTRLTFTNGGAFSPQWSPDGQRFAYATRSAGARLRIGAADGLGGQDSIPVPNDAGPVLSQWAAAGSRLVGHTSSFHGFAVQTDGPERTIQGLPDAEMFAAQPNISPDGRWVAFVSGQPPNVQIFVQSLEGPAGRWQISTRPAAYPKWTKGGREIIYQDQNGALMAVDIDTRSGFSAGTPRTLLTNALIGFGAGSRSWTVDESGEHFYLVQRERADQAGSLEVVTRFTDLVSRK